ncbi:MAG: F510_1955 family glycosylhydrolase [Pseudonocardiales bacterium]
MKPSPRRGSYRRSATLIAAALITLTLAGCSSEGTGQTSAGTSSGPVFEHVHGLGVDPADGAIYVATHDGLFRTRSNGLQLVGAAGRDLMGFTVAGPGTFLSSGHPGPGEQVPNPLGLAESRDGGTTWTTLSLAGEVDFHALDVSPGTVYGYDATNRVLRASTDGGHSWESRAALSALDIAVDPSDPAGVLATVQGGVATSRDGGRTFSAPTGPQLAYLSWAPDGTVYGIGLDGALFTRTDGARGWQQAGVVPGGRPQALTVTKDALLAATAGGVYHSDDRGRTFTPIN